MGSIVKEITVTAGPDQVWDALRDYGAVHERVVPGFVVASELEGPDRVITFSSGSVARERLVSRDAERRRLVYSVVESQLGFTHHQASVEVTAAPSGVGSRIVWSADFLPEEPGEMVGFLMDEGAAAMARAFGQDA